MSSTVMGGIGAMPAEPAVHPCCPHQKRSGGIAALLEVVPGLFFNTFGIGHIYAGNVATGLTVMIGYWIVMAVNVLLCFLLVGFITLPLTWLLTLIFSTLSASKACETCYDCNARR